MKRNMTAGEKAFRVFAIIAIIGLLLSGLWSGIFLVAIGAGALIVLGLPFLLMALAGRRART